MSEPIQITIEGNKNFDLTLESRLTENFDIEINVNGAWVDVESMKAYLEALSALAKSIEACSREAKR